MLDYKHASVLKRSVVSSFSYHLVRKCLCVLCLSAGGQRINVSRLIFELRTKWESNPYIWKKIQSYDMYSSCWYIMRYHLCWTLQSSSMLIHIHICCGQVCKCMRWKTVHYHHHHYRWSAALLFSLTYFYSDFNSSARSI